jgi:hypothetical protein
MTVVGLQPMRDKNAIKNIELLNDITNGFRKYPVIYYTPKRIEAIADYLIADYSSVSSNPANADFTKSFQTIYDKYPDLKPHVLQFKKAYKGAKVSIPEKITLPVYEIENIYHLCDVLYTCKVFACSFSGISSLASAIRARSWEPAAAVEASEGAAVNQSLSSSTPEIYSFYCSEVDPFSTGSHFKMDNVQYLPVIV